MSELKYEWGVEYPTNGVKPDLPDDVVVDIKINNRAYKNQWRSKSGQVRNIAWDDEVTEFRVVDGRYKPEIILPDLNPGKSAPKPVGFIDQAIRAEAKRINEALYAKTLQPATANKYHRQITGIDGTRTTVDVYRVLHAFPTGLPEIDHAVKKLLAPGSKDRITDLREAAQSIECAIKYLEQSE